MLSPEAADVTTRCITDLGCSVEHEHELFAALDRLLSDPTGYEIFVMDTDAFGGMSVGHRAVRLLGELAQRISVILIGADCTEQDLAADRDRPTVLRAPVQTMVLREVLDGAQRQRRVLYA
ncbi:MAG: hypothetical protein ACT4N9_09705 [Paracoccaceae bacterium]